MAAPDDRFIAWCKQEQASIRQQLELMESGKVQTGENKGQGGSMTAELVARAKARLAELAEFVNESGLATVTKLRGPRRPQLFGLKPFAAT